MVNPATGVAENSFPTATQDGVASAVSRLDAGFREWRDRSIADRNAVLSGVADLYVEQAPELAAIITREMGKTTAEALGDHEELFGPVAVVHRVSGIDEAVEMANSSPFGLGGAVFHTDPRRRFRSPTGSTWGWSGSTPQRAAAPSCRSEERSGPGSVASSAHRASMSS